MITKKNLLDRIESLEKELEDIKKTTCKLDSNVDKLIMCHETGTKRSLFGYEYEVYTHKTECGKTERAGDVTLDDLAKLVIDGKPIVIEKRVSEEIAPVCHDLQHSVTATLS